MEQNQAHDMPDFLKKYDKEMELYMQAGLRKKADLVKKEKQIRFIAWQAEQYGMKLIKVMDIDFPSSYYSIRTVPSIGDVKKISRYDKRRGQERTVLFKRMKLENYIGDIPKHILKQLPKDSASKAYIFVADNDPIIALKVNFNYSDRFRKNGYYIATWEWD